MITNQKKRIPIMTTSVSVYVNVSYFFTFKAFLRPDSTSKLVHVLAFGTPKFYIAPYDKIKHELVNLSSNCDVKSSLNVRIYSSFRFLQKQMYAL